MPYDALLTMSALNLAVVSLHRITSTRDRVILDQEYRNIINNLRMGEINADPELTELYQEIVRVIHSRILHDDERLKVYGEYSRGKQKSIGKIITGSYDSNPLKWLGKLAASCASEYFRAKVREKAGELLLLDSELKEYDGLQRKLLGSSWKLLRQYGFPDNYRLTQSALDKFYRAMSEDDTARRLRMLKYIDGEFVMYAPYWFYRADAAREAGDFGDSEGSFRKFGEVWRPVLRKDPYKVEALKYEIESLMRNGRSDEVLSRLDDMRANTELDDWANNIYMGMMYFALGRREKAQECVMCNIDFGFEVENSAELLRKFESGALPKVKASIWSKFSGYLKGEPEQPKPEPEPAPEPEHTSTDELYRKGMKYLDEHAYSLAVSHLTEAAENNHHTSQLQLGYMYYSGEGVKRKESESFRWYREAIKNGEIHSARDQYCIGMLYRRGAFKNPTKAWEWLELAAVQGHPEAQKELAELYRDRGLKKEAEYWLSRFKKSTKQKEQKEQAEQKTPPPPPPPPAPTPTPPPPKPEQLSESEAKKRAKNGDPEAQYQLGCIYAGKTFKVSRVIEWAVPLLMIGMIYYFWSSSWLWNLVRIAAGCWIGFGFPLYVIDGDAFRGWDYDKRSQHWLRKAAENGHNEAQFRLAETLTDNARYSDALDWYTKAAEHGHSEAMYTLGEIYNPREYHRGFVGYDDSGQAERWYKNAAMRGHIKAMRALNRFYRHYSSSQPYDAYMWGYVAYLCGGTLNIGDKPKPGNLKQSEASQAEAQAQGIYEQIQKLKGGYNS